jgi:hypothetical protein
LKDDRGIGARDGPDYTKDGGLVVVGARRADAVNRQRLRPGRVGHCGRDERDAIVRPASEHGTVVMVLKAGSTGPDNRCVQP